MTYKQHHEFYSHQLINRPGTLTGRYSNMVNIDMNKGKEGEGLK